MQLYTECCLRKDFAYFETYGDSKLFRYVTGFVALKINNV
jgi:hypothetical protein